MVAIRHLIGGGGNAVPESFASLAAADFLTTTAPSSIGPSPSSSSSLLSILSWNVLLPNSVDGWWNFKMYNPPLQPEQQYQGEWPYRQELVKERLAATQPNIVCFQEVCPESFEDDFAFMSSPEMGYDGVAMFNKGRFRPATFWKTKELELVTPPVHKDRTLLTVFKPVKEATDDEPNNSQRNLYVLNCHLQAGNQAPRRVRQIHEGMRAIMTTAKKLKDPGLAPDVNSNKKRNKNNNDNTQTSHNLPILVCGDFNGGQECGAVHYLEQGCSIDENFMEDGQQVSSGTKALPVPQPMMDVMAAVERRTRSRDSSNDDNTEGATTTQQSTTTTTPSSKPPPTMVVRELISLLVDTTTQEKQDKTAYEEPDLSPAALERLERIYNRLATGQNSNQNDNVAANVMTTESVEQWLTIINGRVGRGSEFREAVNLMEQHRLKEEEEANDNDQPGSETKDSREQLQEPATAAEEKPTKVPENAILTLQDFQAIYTKELRQGKFWGIAYDLHVLGEPLDLKDDDNFQARYDRLYCSDATTAVRPVAVMDFLCSQACPNSVEPSDHLPVAAAFLLSPRTEEEMQAVANAGMKNNNVTNKKNKNKQKQQG